MKKHIVTLFLVVCCALRAQQVNPDDENALKQWHRRLTKAKIQMSTVHIRDLGLTLVPIKAGSFTMGSPASEIGRSADEKQHKVSLTRPFWMGKTEVTQGQWKAVMGTSIRDVVRQVLRDDTRFRFANRKRELTLREWWNLKKDSDPMKRISNAGDDRPMVYVSWYDAMQFCKRLTKREHDSGRLSANMCYRLPTEAEWEYACRAATKGSIFTGKMKIIGLNNAPALDKIAWYGGNSSVGYKAPTGFPSSWKEKQYTGGHACWRVVGQKLSNSWGLHDMIGNVSEWCSDWYSTSCSSKIDPQGPLSGVRKIHRGGSWSTIAKGCRSASRSSDVPHYKSNAIGFRIVRGKPLPGQLRGNP